MYSPAAYFLSKIMVELPVYVIFSIIVAIVTFYMMDLGELSVDATKTLVRYMLILVLNNLTSCAFGYSMACLTGNVKYAVVIAPALLFQFILIEGPYMIGEAKVKFLNWIKHIAWQSWVLHGMLINQWEGVTGIRCNRINTTCLPDGTMTGKMVLEQVKAEKDDIEENIWRLVALFFMYMVIALFALIFRLRKRT
jgi:hypothetical protein